MTNFTIVIPARYASERLPGKPLRELAGKPMLAHVCDRAGESSAAAVFIATDDPRIEVAATGFGADVCMTSTQHQSGTDRLAEVADAMSWSDDQVVVNLQGDEPMMPAALIDQCAGLLTDPGADLGTLASPLERAEDMHNPNAVKVVCDDAGFALYFSRSPIPYSRSAATDSLAIESALHHHGIYAYRVGTLRKIVAAEQSTLERCEHLEQLRALSIGLRIKVGIPTQRPGPGIDTEEDLQRAEQQMSGG